ncbi:MAG: hypothetical protein AAGA99_16520 [Actinomycetota bacterium]
MFLAAGVVAVFALSIGLAASRSSDDADDRTEAPTTTSGAATTTDIANAEPTAGTGSSEPPANALDQAAVTVNVSSVPEELTYLQLIVLTTDGAASLDLSTGDLVPFDAPEAPSAGYERIQPTDLGIVVFDSSNGTSRLVDWDLSTSIDLGDGGWPAHFDGERLWFVDWGGDGRELATLDAAGARVTVWDMPEAAELIGTSEAAAYVTSHLSGSTHRVGIDGTVTAAHDGIAISGGHDWILSPTCDAQLRCGLELVDLRSGSPTRVSDLAPTTRFTAVAPAGVSRRALAVAWADAEHSLIIDADNRTATSIRGGGTSTDPSELTTDPEVRYQISSRLRRVSFTELATGIAWSIELPDIVRRVVIAPEGWTPPPPTSS